MSGDEISSRRGGPFLTVTVNYTEVARFPLFERTITLGRSMDCDLQLGDPILSRQHCRLEPALEGDGWVVIDLKSRNGTFVNAKRVERSPLNDGDVVTIGRAHITFHKEGYMPPRPAGPHEAVRMPANRAAMPRGGSASSRPLPTPAPRDPNADTIAPGDSASGLKPLPFTRPPAKPMPSVDEDDE